MLESKIKNFKMPIGYNSVDAFVNWDSVLSFPVKKLQVSLVKVKTFRKKKRSLKMFMLSSKLSLYRKGQRKGRRHSTSRLPKP